MMKRACVSGLCLGMALLILGCGKKGDAVAAASPSPAAALSDAEKAVYALGAAMGEQARGTLKPLMLTPAELEIFKKGLVASLAGEKPTYTMEQYGAHLDARAKSNAPLLAAEAKKAGVAFAEQAAKEQGAVKTASGLVYKTITPGQGASPKATDVVRVHYHGTLVDGTVFDSSVQRGQPAELPLNGVIPCWTEGVQRMKVGEKARLVCPGEIAYGERPNGPGGPNATLVFEVELLGIGRSRQAAAGAQGR